MLIRFPPGGTAWKKYRDESHWREFDFMFNQVKRAIEPDLPLRFALDAWGDISRDLAERPRKRRNQPFKKMYAQTS